MGEQREGNNSGVPSRVGAEPMEVLEGRRTLMHRDEIRWTPETESEVLLLQEDRVDPALLPSAAVA